LRKKRKRHDKIDHQVKKRRVAKGFFCPVCKEIFATWEECKTHFKDTAHLGAHCCICGRSFEALSHRNLHEKDTGHDMFKGLLVQKQKLVYEEGKTEIGSVKDAVSLLIDNGSVEQVGKCMVENFYHGNLSTMLDELDEFIKQLEQKLGVEKMIFFIIDCIQYLIKMNVYKGVVKLLCIPILLA